MNEEAENMSRARNIELALLGLANRIAEELGNTYELSMAVSEIESAACRVVLHGDKSAAVED